MSEMKLGTVSINLPDDLTLPEEAGNLSSFDVRRMVKAKKNVSSICSAVSEAMGKHPERICPRGVTSESLEIDGMKADALNGTITDLNTMLTNIQQSDMIFGAEAHESLRKVLAFVRSNEKFDHHLADLVPELLDYFSTRRRTRRASSDTPSAETGIN